MQRQLILKQFLLHTQLCQLQKHFLLHHFLQHHLMLPKLLFSLMRANYSCSILVASNSSRCSCSTAPAALHLQHCTCRAAPATLHLLVPCTFYVQVLTILFIFALVLYLRISTSHVRTDFLLQRFFRLRFCIIIISYATWC